MVTTMAEYRVEEGQSQGEPSELLGFQFRENVEDERLKLVAIEVKWKGPNKGLHLVPLSEKPYPCQIDYTGGRDYTAMAILKFHFIFF